MGKQIRSGKGPEPYLGKDTEDRLARWLIKMARIGFGQTKDQLFDKVQKIVTELNIMTPFPNNRPTDDWFRCFIKCYPKLSRCQPMLLS